MKLLQATLATLFAAASFNASAADASPNLLETSRQCDALEAMASTGEQVADEAAKAGRLTPAELEDLQLLIARCRMGEVYAHAANIARVIDADAKAGATQYGSRYRLPQLPTSTVESIFIDRQTGMFMINTTSKVGAGSILWMPTPPLTPGVPNTQPIQWDCGGGSLHPKYRLRACF